MSDEQLAAELQSVQQAFFNALKERNVDAYLAAGILPKSVTEDAIRSSFDQFAEFMAGQAVDPSGAELITLKTLDDDRAGLYCRLPSEKGDDWVAVGMTPFRRVDGVWKVAGQCGTAGTRMSGSATPESVAEKFMNGPLKLELYLP